MPQPDSQAKPQLSIPALSGTGAYRKLFELAEDTASTS
jgi:hypothetical protein